MNEDFNFLYEYLEKEELYIDRIEFEFQIKSHPDYPSLLSITDTLTFFNIENGALHVDSHDLELLPDNFVTFFNDGTENTGLYFMEKKKGSYFYSRNNSPVGISEKDLKSNWHGIVLLIENSKIENPRHTSKFDWQWLLPALCATLLVLNFLNSTEDNVTKLFFIFPILGILFSIASLKDLFGTDNKLINSFCNLTPSTNCTTIINSKKWKIFELINFSDLSIIFFTSQFFGQITFLLEGNTAHFFVIQKIALFCSIPFLLLSLYYQKFKEQKWCPICLAISVIIIIELVYIAYYKNYFLELNKDAIIQTGLIFATLTFIWLLLKKILTQHKDLKEFHLKGNRFMRNYDVFKNTLTASVSIEKTSLVSEKILLGNFNAPLVITMITSPFCKYCDETFTIINNILQKHPNQVCFDVRFNYNNAFNDPKSKTIHQKLISSYFDKGPDFFLKTLDHWFKNKNEKDLDGIEISKEETLKIDKILNEQFYWNQKNDFTYTPEILVNDYVYPKQYEKNQLIHFINELSEDETLYL